MTTQAIVCYIVQIFSAFEPRYQCYLLMLRTNNCISFTNTWAHSELFMVVAHLFSLMVLFLFLFFICLFVCFCFLFVCLFVFVFLIVFYLILNLIFFIVTVLDLKVYNFIPCSACISFTE